MEMSDHSSRLIEEELALPMYSDPKVQTRARELLYDQSTQDPMADAVDLNLISEGLYAAVADRSVSERQAAWDSFRLQLRKTLK
jgi:ParB-like chromosome segregation protein Spo0J